MRVVPVVIPAYEPDGRLVKLIEELVGLYHDPIVVINDGSGLEYQGIFDTIQPIIKQHGGTIIEHDGNKGKGRALKTAFAYIITQYPEAIGCVTADSDGQHSPQCIMKVAEMLKNMPNSLILGVRNFSAQNIPWKSRMGNQITEKVFAYIAGVHVTDTQTGLRGIPFDFMQKLLDVQGERFEFEIQMLLESTGRYSIVETEIETIYDSVENHQTHFNSVVDSAKIYSVLGKRFGKYIFSSFSSSIIDFVIFGIMCSMLRHDIDSYIAVSTVAARCISSIYNYLLNYKFVFISHTDVKLSGIKYFALVIIQMILSALLVTGAAVIMPVVPEVALKMIVDTFLFFVSYKIQQRYVFR